MGQMGQIYLLPTSIQTLQTRANPIGAVTSLGSIRSARHDHLAGWQAPTQPSVNGQAKYDWRGQGLYCS